MADASHALQILRGCLLVVDNGLPRLDVGRPWSDLLVEELTHLGRACSKGAYCRESHTIDEPFEGAQAGSMLDFDVGSKYRNEIQSERSCTVGSISALEPIALSKVKAANTNRSRTCS